MLNFRNTNLFFIILLLFVVLVHVNKGVSFFVYPALLFVYSLVVFYGCYFVDSNFFLPVTCSAKTTDKVIAISFDDGPVNDFTPQILQVLDNANVSAAFFCIGNRIEGNEPLFRKLHTNGHLIGNHSYSHHFWFDLFSAKKMKADLKMMDDKMESVIGLKSKLFRPPYGVTNPNVKKAIIEGGYTPVGWSVRSMDTIIKSEDKLTAKLKHGLAPGAVYLFHDTGKLTLSVLPGFINWVKENGYEIVRLDKLLNLKAYA